MKEREGGLVSRTSSHVWRGGDRWVRHRWRLQLSDSLTSRISPYSKSPNGTWSRASSSWQSCFDDDFLGDLETWTALYDPAGITLSFKDPEDALFKPPNKVLIDNRQTECFFKPCNSSVQIKRELEAYKMILAAGLDSQLYLCHLYGIVMDDSDFILGLLLTYIDNGDCPLSTRIHPDEPDDPPTAIRERWLGQLDAALAGLHKAGVVWRDRDPCASSTCQSLSSFITTNDSPHDLPERLLG